MLNLNAVFQDRKLNNCATCGTKKQLGIQFDTSGKAYFLCRTHAFILASTLPPLLEMEW